MISYMISFAIDEKNYDMTYDIIGQCVQSTQPPPPAAPAAAASLRRFLVSAALILLSLRRSLLILSASAIDTIRGRPRPYRHIQMFTS